MAPDDSSRAPYPAGRGQRQHGVILPFCVLRILVGNAGHQLAALRARACRPSSTPGGTWSANSGIAVSGRITTGQGCWRKSCVISVSVWARFLAAISFPGRYCLQQRHVQFPGIPRSPDTVFRPMPASQTNTAQRHGQRGAGFRHSSAPCKSSAQDTEPPPDFTPPTGAQPAADLPESGCSRCCPRKAGHHRRAQPFRSVSTTLAGPPRPFRTSR